MNVPVTEAKARLTDLIRRAEDGEEVVLTRHGHAVARIAPLHLSEAAIARRRAAIEAIAREGVRTALPGPCAARSQDFLYDEDGLPT